ncbi:MAG: crossover junction endodeoxyribonuclease RuvC [Mariprofundaceae bacterium]|nr:crossover junction endodeoxyribonuclease RuvC [Mariprofundaceae bacterium]
MRILGVDPGSQKTGVGILDVQGNHLKYVHHSVIRVGTGDFSERLTALFSGLSSIIETFKPELAAMEDVFVSKNVTSALKLGQARGALLAACGFHGLHVEPYSPTKVKQSITGFGRADKKQVQHMVNMLLKPPPPLQEDAADALAVCICHAHHAPLQNITTKRR